VPVDVPEPVGEAPSPVSDGTITPFADEVAGGGKLPSTGTGAAAGDGGAPDDVVPQASVITANAPSTPRKQQAPSDAIIRAM